MRILYFTSLRATHSKKWLMYFAQRAEVHVATFRNDAQLSIPGVTIHEILPSEKTNAMSAEKPQEYRLNSAAKEAWLTFKIGIKFARRFGQLIDTVNPDFIHAHQSVPFGWYAVRAQAASKLKPPLLVSVWGTDVMGYPEKSWLFRYLNKITLKRAHYLSATGYALRRAAQRWASRRAIDIVPFGVDTDLFAQKKTPSEKVTVFGMAKSLKPVYRIDVAIQALAKAREKVPGLRLEIAGDGPQKKELQDLAARLHVSDAVRFLGAIENQKMPAILRSWDALIFISQQESFGVGALEAQAVGIPILAARTGGVTEVVRENVTARFVEPVDPENLADAMTTLHTDTAFIQQAFLKGPQFVREKFTWRESGEQMHALYNKIVPAHV
jgi:glycosyltransferase involved in cell wall biosynthesis